MVNSKSFIRGRDASDTRQLVPGSTASLKKVRESLGRIRGMLDATDHALTEFIQTQKMASIGHLVRGIGHDLRNGLVIIGLNVQQLKNSHPERGIRRRLSDIQDVLEDMEGLLGRLMALGPGDVSEELYSAELSSEVKGVLNGLGAGIPKDITLHFSTARRPLPVLLGRGDMWRVVTNLVKNAVEAMPKGGDLLISTSYRKVGIEYCRMHGNARPGDFAVLTLCDHGTGIEPDILDRIFDPLFSTRKSDDAQAQRGWGLAIVYSLVNRRGGWIDVSSTVGQGTTFEVFLPVTEEKSV